MYDINDTIVLLQTTNYTVEKLRAKEPVLSELANLPIVYVGYLKINSKNPTSAESFSNYEQFGENLTQTLEMHICCEEVDLPVVWRKVYNSLSGKNTTPAEQQFSSLTYQNGGLVGIENTRLWWIDRWAVQFPSLNTFNF